MNEFGVQLNAIAFDDSFIQDQIRSDIMKLLRDAAEDRMAARRVDVVGHSMGGLVTRALMSTPSSSGYLPPDVVHTLITIGTPHDGTQLTQRLYEQRLTTNNSSWRGLFIGAICAVKAIAPCNLSNLFERFLKKPIASGVVSLQPASEAIGNLSPLAEYNAIQGQAPVDSWTEWQLDLIIGGFLAGESVNSIMNTSLHDTLVSLDSQRGGASIDVTEIDGIVHTALQFSGNTGETSSPAVWNQVFTWLTGQPPPAQAAVSATKALSNPLPRFDLTGYTETDNSNVSFSPVTGSMLTIGTPTDIIASSVTKTISTVLLFQMVVDPMDAPMLAATESPFAISFMPARLGTAEFVAFTLFTDMTYAVTALTYFLQPGTIPFSLGLGDRPNRVLESGMTVHFGATAGYLNGTIDVSNAATYVARSGTAAVIGVGPGGSVHATGNGVDWLDVSYGGLNTSARISVITPPPTVLDIDGNKAYEPLTDGLMVVRYLFGLTGPALTDGAIGTGAKTTDPTAILAKLNSLKPQFDVDANGQVDALTDGLMLVRYLFGQRGDSLITGAIGAGANSTQAKDIEEYIKTLVP